jgi:hypothetical protein
VKKNEEKNLPTRYVLQDYQCGNQTEGGRRMKCIHCEMDIVMTVMGVYACRCENAWCLELEQ